MARSSARISRRDFPRRLRAALQRHADRLLPLAVAGFFAALAGRYLVRCWQSWVPGGWDGVAHFAVADLYARRIFPALSGWLPEYFAGLPFPDFYPPLFYFLVALVARLGPSLPAAFLGLQTAAAFALPVLHYVCARRLADSRLAGVVAGALAAGFMVDGHPMAYYGITLRATFDIGLSTQLLAFCFTLTFYACHLEAHRRRGAALAASLAFAAVALTNVHVVWDAAVLFLGLAAARILARPRGPERRRALALELVVGGSAVLLSACWVVPMLARLEFVPTMALPPPPAGLVLVAFFRLGVYLVLAAAAAGIQRDHRVLGLVASLVLLLVFAAFPATDYLADLALQPGRFLIGFEFLTTLLVGYLVAQVRQLTRRAWVQGAAAAACIAVYFLYIEPVKDPFGNVSTEQGEGYQQVLDELADRRDGRVLVEMGRDSPSDSFALQALVGRAGAYSLTTVFRESSLNVLFAGPLRNAFSSRQDSFGVDSKIPGGAELAAQGAERQRARLDLFGVRYFAVRTATARRRIQALPGAHRISPQGGWEVYALEGGRRSPFARVPRYAPVLTFSRFTVKRRNEHEIDFIRLGEERFVAGRFDPPLALAPSGLLDGEEGWERFGAALVTEYRYRDPQSAYAAVEAFSRSRPVVLLASPDPLFRRLEALAGERPNLRVVPPAESSGRLDPGETARRLLAAVDELSRPLATPVEVAAVELDGGVTAVTLSAEPPAPVPVWVQQGHLPNWRRDDGSPVYLASPTFQLTFACERRIELRFRPTRAAWVGGVASLLGLALAAGWELRRRRASPA